MNKLFKFILCGVIVSSFCLTAAVGCQRQDQGEDTDTDPVSDVTESITEETEETLNDVDTLAEYDFDGAKYNVLSRASSVYEWSSNSELGNSTINNAVFIRNELVKERFNVDIVIDEVGGWWNNDPQKCPWYVKYHNNVQSGWSAYSMVTGHFSMAQVAAVSGFCIDMTALETIDMQKEWWSKPFYDMCNLNGKFYVAVGDIGYSMYESMYVMYFNETLAGEVLKDPTGASIDLYELVRDNEWTWEKLNQYILQINDVGMAEADKRYGFMGTANGLRAFATSFEVEYAESDENNGYLVYRFPQNALERTSRILDGVGSFFTTTAANSVKNFVDESTGNSIFSSGRALFYAQMLGQLPSIAEGMGENQKYGILPYPMYDDNQLEYHTDCYNGASGITVPKNVQDLEMAGVITEALCMYSYQEIRPVYLDTVLDGRYMTDDNISEMVDLIRESFVISFFNAYGGAIGTPHVSSATDAMFSDSSQKYSSYYAGYLSKYQSNLENFYKSYGIIN